MGLSIVDAAFRKVSIESEERVRKAFNDFDIKHLENEIKLCYDGINNGNWEGYSENLQDRKLRLKEMNIELKKLKQCQ